MDLTALATKVGAAAEELTQGEAGPLPPVEVKSPQARAGYDHLIDAMNRLPRPLMAIGSVGIFVAAGVNPAWFEQQMQALNAMPEPLWWILGAVLTMFFGSREAHYIRRNAPPKG